MGSVYVPPAQGPSQNTGTTSATSGSSDTPCLGTCTTLERIKYDYLQGYFNAHMLSSPSWRYFYWLWFVLVAFALCFSAFSASGVGSRSFVGAAWRKWMTKNRVIKIGKKSPYEAKSSLLSRGHSRKGTNQGSGSTYNPLATPTQYSASPQAQAIPPPGFTKPRKIIQLPSLGRMLLLVALFALPICLSLIGADYINPNAGVFDISQSFPNNTITPYNIQTQRRSLAAGFSGGRWSGVVQLARRGLQWGQGAFPDVGTVPVNTTIPYRTWWTIGGRLGGMTNALTPLALLLALKQVPWALLSTRALGGYSFDRLSFLHKWVGRIVWLFATAHIVTWSVQLGMDTAIGGQMIWSFVFLWPRFRWGFVSYIFLTALVALSIGPIRRKYYEVFYICHVVCIIGFMISAWLHHPPLGAWMYVPLLWWLAERITRAVKVAWINGLGFAGRKPVSVGSANGQQPLLHKAGTGAGMNGHANGKSYYAGPDSYSSPPSTASEKTFGSRATRNAYGAPGGPHSRGPSTSTFATAYSASAPSHHQYEHPLARPSSPPPFNDPLHQGTFSQEGHALRSMGQVNAPLAAADAAAAHEKYGPIEDVISSYTPKRKSEFAPEEYEGYVPQSAPALPRSSSYGPAFVLEDRGPGVASSDSGTLAQHPASSADLYNSANGNMPRTQSSYSFGSSTMLGSNSSTGFYEFKSPGSGFANARMNGMKPPSLRPQPRPILAADVKAVLKPGFAFVQLLPGKALRLTIRTPNHISWLPGQWINLNMPAVRWWESHPFTIASAYDATYSSSRRRHKNQSSVDVEKDGDPGGKAPGEERTITLLLRARKGFTKHLFDYVQKQRNQQIGDSVISSGGISKSTTGVHLRALIDGPYGSTKRVDWGASSTVVIICAGSGVSFGMAVLEHLCACLARSASGVATKKSKVSRVRFVWMLREFSHLQWVASALIRCIQMLPPEQLQVDLFVTHFNNQSALLPQEPNHHSSNMMPGGPPSPSWPSSPLPVPMSSRQARFTEGPQQEDFGFDANDLTQFEGEADETLNDMEMEINDRIRKEGRLRRAHTRKVTMKRKGGAGIGANGKAGAKQSYALASQRAVYEGWASAGRDAPMADLNESVGSPVHSQHNLLAPPRPVGAGEPGSFSGTSSPWSRPGTPDSFGHFTPQAQSQGHSDAAHSAAHLVPADPTDNAVPIDLDEQEDQDMRVLAELARTGHPKLDRIIREEAEISKGSTLVTSCGPNSLAVVIRSIVTSVIDPARVRKGDMRGMVDVVTESYDWGG